MEIRLKDIPEFPSVEMPPPMERDARVLSFLHRPLSSCSGSWGVGLFQSHIFFPNEIVDCVFLGCSSGTSVLSLTHVQGKSHPSVESRWAQRRWSCLPSENSGPMVAMAMARCPPWIVTPQTLCEKRGEGWAQSGKLSPSPLNCCILGSLSS